MDLSDIKGVIFDLDGTLLESRLDFAAMRKAIDCPSDTDILVFIAAISCEKARGHAESLVLQHELTDAKTAGWLTIGKQMVEKVTAAGLPMAIVTRNSREATALKLKNNNVPITRVLTREDAPPKPDPTALLTIANEWGFTPQECLYVGDYIYDRLAAENAGMRWHLIK